MALVVLDHRIAAVQGRLGAQGGQAGVEFFNPERGVIRQATDGHIQAADRVVDQKLGTLHDTAWPGETGPVLVSVDALLF